MDDLIDAVVTEVLDGETIALRVIHRDPANRGSYAGAELLRVITGPGELTHQEPREETAAAVRRVEAGASVCCRVRERGSDGTLIGEIERLPRPLHALRSPAPTAPVIRSVP